VRDLAKSMIRFSWAMSMFGLEQMAKLVKEEHSGSREEHISAAFDSVTKAAGRQFTGRVRSVFDAGDRLQSESVDFMFDMVRAENWKPDKVADKAADLAERSADALRDSRKSRKGEGGEPGRKG
jgi:hypothetical protein